MIGSLLVIAHHLPVPAQRESTLIICTSIPISVIGTFALLYFGGYTLNTLTFGGLALGIGMIVDAAIVVLENTYRHLEMGKDRMTAAIDGSEEVWSAILASTLTHIAVFVPMLFLTGVSSIMFGQLAAVVSFSLAMSLFVAVTIVPGAVLALPRCRPITARTPKGVFGALYRWQRSGARTGSTRSTRALCTRAPSPPDGVCDGLRPLRRGALPAAAHRLRVPAARPTRARSRWMPSWRSARASSAPRRVLIQLEEPIRERCPRRRC